MQFEQSKTRLRMYSMCATLVRELVPTKGGTCMKCWVRMSVLKSAGRRNWRGVLHPRNQDLIGQQKLNRMGNVKKKMELISREKEAQS